MILGIDDDDVFDAENMEVIINKQKSVISEIEMKEAKVAKMKKNKVDLTDLKDKVRIYNNDKQV